MNAAAGSARGIHDIEYLPAHSGPVAGAGRRNRRREHDPQLMAAAL